MHNTRLKPEPIPSLLTVGQASTLMRSHRCRHTSNRKVQRMCRDGVIECQKITTTRDGNPITEWLVDEASLLKHIRENEPKWSGTPREMNVAATGDGRAHLGPSGDADERIETSFSKDNQRNGVTPPTLERAASGDARINEASENQGVTAGDAMATPDSDGDAADIVGETRRLADVLIDNAKLTAELAGANVLIEAITDEKSFLREELREARAGRKDVTAIAQRMLETLETIAIGGKLMPVERESHERSNPPGADTADDRSRLGDVAHDNTVEDAEQVQSAKPSQSWAPVQHSPPRYGDNASDPNADLRI
ncbi:MAG: hypothetical protein AAFR71_02595 [Pseudomonadota bacterium]